MKSQLSAGMKIAQFLMVRHEKPGYARYSLLLVYLKEKYICRLLFRKRLPYTQDIKLKMGGNTMNESTEVLDLGPFFHGTKAQLAVGDLLESQNPSNFQDKKSNYIYFTATLDAAKWGAELAATDLPERIYIVEPTGTFENDPNLTDKRFPGNPTRSYRSKEPLKIVAELAAWERHSDDQIKHMLGSLKSLREQGKAVIID